MNILSKLQGLVGRESSKDEHVPAEEPEIAEAKKRKSKAHFFVLQALKALKKLELEGGIFICASPDFECYFKKKYMPLFEDKDTYIKVAFDEADNVTHVCGLLPRLQHEKDRENITDENLTLSKVPDCLLSRAIAGLSPVSRNNMSKTGNVVDQGRTSPRQQQNSKARDVAHQDRTVSTQQHIYKAKNVVPQRRAASAQQQNSNIVYDPHLSTRSLRGVEKEWLDSMHASLVDSEYEILLHLLQHSIITRGFQEKIEHFLITKKELQPDNSSVVIDAFKYLAREFQIKEQTISVAWIGTRLEKMFNLKPKEIFSIIVELFFCLGYEKEIKGYTTGFIE